MKFLFIIRCVKSNIVGTPSHIFVKVMCRNYLPWEFAAAIFCGFLPREFAAAICRGFLPWLFAVGIGRSYLPKQFAVRICGGFVLCM